MLVPAVLWGRGSSGLARICGRLEGKGQGGKGKGPTAPAVCPSDVPVRRPLVLPPFPGAWSWAGPGFPSVRAKFQVRFSLAAGPWPLAPGLPRRGWPLAVGRWRIANRESRIVNRRRRAVSEGAWALLSHECGKVLPGPAQHKSGSRPRRGWDPFEQAAKCNRSRRRRGGSRECRPRGLLGLRGQRGEGKGKRFPGPAPPAFGSRGGVGGRLPSSLFPLPFRSGRRTARTAR